jgi:hypothetical protein
VLQNKQHRLILRRSTHTILHRKSLQLALDLLQPFREAFDLHGERLFFALVERGGGKAQIAEVVEEGFDMLETMMEGEDVGEAFFVFVVDENGTQVGRVAWGVGVGDGEGVANVLMEWKGRWGQCK